MEARTDFWCRASLQKLEQHLEPEATLAEFLSFSLSLGGLVFLIPFLIYRLRLVLAETCLELRATLALLDLKELLFVEVTVLTPSVFTSLCVKQVDPWLWDALCESPEQKLIRLSREVFAFKLFVEAFEQVSQAFKRLLYCFVVDGLLLRLLALL